VNPWDIIQKWWRPALEIAILAVVIHYALTFVRRTRGWPVVLGLFVLLVATIITSVLKLQVLNWLLTAFLTISALGFLILFQPELRRLLAELGNISRTASAQDEREHIEIVVQTAERLAEARIGALMAMEVRDDLAEAVESGILVDCQATPEMLETIFFPNNAIHDGGVILRGGRIQRAACIFPLTQRQDLNKSVGTRHRAAIGLTEETDAVVVVVSEETGAISHVYKGEMQKGVTLEALRAFLTSVFVKPARPRTVAESVRGLATRIKPLLARAEGKR
jgi:diadenylate cyclase